MIHEYTRTVMDAKLTHAAIKVTDGLSNNLQVLANEPSLGMFRVQEHVRRNMPSLVERKVKLHTTLQNVKGVSFDIDYVSSIISSMSSIENFSRTQRLLNAAINYKESINRNSIGASSKKEQQQHQSSLNINGSEDDVHEIMDRTP